MYEFKRIMNFKLMRSALVLTRKQYTRFCAIKMPLYDAVFLDTGEVTP